MKVVFLGSGPFGLPTLELLARRPSEVELARVVSRPDRPGRRGGPPAPMPVRARALELGIPCEAPETVNAPGFVETLAALRADVYIVADYGELVRKAVRALPRVGVFNLHASLLPRHRGAAPVAHALLAGDDRTGVTLFRIEAGLDSGPVLDREEVTVLPEETAGELEARLAVVAAGLLERNLGRFARGDLVETAQDAALATPAPKLTKDQGRIDWGREAVAVSNHIRAMNPWPAAWTLLHAGGRAPERTLILRARPGAGGGDPPREPGTVVEVRKDGFRAACREGTVEVLELQREGKAPLAAAAFLRGRPLRPGDRFG